MRLSKIAFPCKSYQSTRAPALSQCVGCVCVLKYVQHKLFACDEWMNAEDRLERGTRSRVLFRLHVLHMSRLSEHHYMHAKWHATPSDGRRRGGLHTYCTLRAVHERNMRAKDAGETWRHACKRNNKKSAVAILAEHASVCALIAHSRYDSARPICLAPNPPTCAVRQIRIMICIWLCLPCAPRHTMIICSSIPTHMHSEYQIKLLRFRLLASAMSLCNLSIFIRVCVQSPAVCKSEHTRRFP